MKVSTTYFASFKSTINVTCPLCFINDSVALSKKFFKTGKNSAFVISVQSKEVKISLISFDLREIYT